MPTLTDPVRVNDGADTTMRSVEALTIRYCTVDEVAHAPNIDELVAEYVEESHQVEVPQPDPQWDHYRMMQAAKIFQYIGAFKGHKLIGFIGVVTSKLPHHGKAVSVTESFFVAKQFRSTGAGIKMLRAAEEHAKAFGSPCLVVSAPHNGVLEAIMPRLGYREAQRIFIRSLT